MEQSEQPLDHSPEEESPDAHPELLLTDALMRFFNRNARMGTTAMILLLVFAIMNGLFWLYRFFIWQGNFSGDFYLLEGKNARRVWDFASSLILILMFGQSAWTGRRSMRNIYIGLCNEDDQALLDGFEQLSLTKKRFVYWGAFWVVCVLFEEIFLK